MDISKSAFNTGANYLARSNSYTGSVTITLPGSGLTKSAVIPHNLGYIPFFEVGADVDNDGIIWHGNKINLYTETSLGGVSSSSPTLKAWSTTTDLTILLDNTTTPVATGSRTLYYTIYLDYGNV